MGKWINNNDGTSSFKTNKYGTITVDTKFISHNSINNVSTDDILYHEYSEINTLGIEVGLINEQKLFESFRAFPTPFGEDFAGPGWVNHEFSSDTKVVNYTIPYQHIIHPGLVVREIIIVNGVYAIKTYGIGAGAFPNINVDLANEVWTFADSRLIDHLVRNVGLEIMDSIPNGSTFYNSFVGHQFLESTASLIIEDLNLNLNEVEKFSLNNITATALKIITLNKNNLTQEDLEVIRDAIIVAISDSNINVGTAGKISLAIVNAYNQKNGTDVDNCFLAGTMVTMADGSLKAIEEIIVGDMVASYADDNPISNQLTAQKVTNVFRNGIAISILDCIKAEGMIFNSKTGLVNKPNEQPMPLNFFGQIPKPEDYILNKSKQSLEAILVANEWEGTSSELIAARLRHTNRLELN